LHDVARWANGRARARPGARARWRALARGATAALTLALAGCSAAPHARPSDAGSPAILAELDAAGILDLRGAYRAALCRRLEDAPVSCNDVLLRLPGEQPVTRAAPPSEEPARRYRVAFVQGLLAECVGGLVRPFADVEADLARAGAGVHHLEVAGRGTSAANAEQLARQVVALPDDPRPLILIAHSKGLPDVLELVASHPAAARHVAAVVSVAGVANGSLLADEMAGTYRTWLSALPLPGCAPGTGEEIRDVARASRIEWWRQHRAVTSVPVFSLVATPRPDRLTRVMAPTYRRLARIDPRNDGMLFWYDQIAPGSHLLGYVNADHVAVALSIAQEFPFVGFLFRDVDVPRTLLIEAAIEVVDRTLLGP
jgi:hypothetical protein